MTELEQMLAERACERLMIEYCECVDTRDFARLVTLFARDGVLKRPDGEWKGRAEIGAFFDKLTTDPLIHASSNMLVSIAGQTGSGTSYVTVFRSYGTNPDGLPKLDAPYVVAKYVDSFIIEDGEWKIGVRDTIFAAKV